MQTRRQKSTRIPQTSVAPTHKFSLQCSKVNIERSGTFISTTANTGFLEVANAFSDYQENHDLPQHHNHRRRQTVLRTLKAQKRQDQVFTFAKESREKPLHQTRITAYNPKLDGLNGKLNRPSSPSLFSCLSHTNANEELD